MKALISGVTGFIGGAIADYLSGQEWEVYGLARPASQAKLGGAAREWRIIPKDFTDPCLGAALPAGIDVVIHSAAIRNRWGTSAAQYEMVNVSGTQSFLKSVLGKARRFIYISSVGVFGKTAHPDIDETFPVVDSDQNNAYHRSKIRAEEIVNTFSREGQIETVILRPTIVYGPGDTDGMITRLIEMVAEKRYIQIGDGKNYIHLTYIDDLLDGIKQATISPSAAGKTFNLSGPEPVQVMHLIRMIQQATGIKGRVFSIPLSFARLAGWAYEVLTELGRLLHLLPPDFLPLISGDKVDIISRNRSFSSSLAQNHLGYSPHVGCAEGLAKTVDWLHELEKLHKSFSETAYAPHNQRT